MNTIKSKASGSGAIAIHGLGLLGAMLLTGCAALPAVPTRPMLYDFGPASVAPAPAGRRAALPALVLADVEAPGLPDGSSAVLYRLAYADARQLHPYSHARWSQPPAQLLQQQLREQIGRRRAVLKADDGAAQSRGATRSGHLLLRVELEEFSHLFNSPTQSAGVVRLRATMVERTPTGESLRGQRVFIMQKPARSTDAAGGVAALAEASTQLASELAEWVEQVESTPH
ncbi:ABC-type transport auxiliary lipoprotein family protein [Verminephrobacter eiseniae]|uniref:Putative lipoprotein n=1 Tax=Verminephrobacter eiseniae (strain EF01-2) TaxID=391735 RepID=A1WGE5_VEREI|nr:ABC-type transport auxiliary lipoprotein family protein [Verminephrobacter eiseniae]ABM56702.1 putative lipoprotein [Verminephrobacter eiseniae EF01-2]MCW5287059.1 hypothetical protein [Verminephrobacter eiseniae]MCW5305357.1 hypothetical protein [Verminephrobacter eiseniae]MCW8179152.1 hypothetical protein [Verminephrobacter eiseniae]MCW8189786.1 hypothetical protein [Verminephrobacter eiseniae]